MADSTLAAQLQERSQYLRSRNRDLEDINTADMLDAAVTAITPLSPAPPPVNTGQPS